MNTRGMHIFKDSTHRQVISVPIFKQESKRSFELRVSASSTTRMHNSKGPRSCVCQGNRCSVALLSGASRQDTLPAAPCPEWGKQSSHQLLFSIRRNILA